MQIVIDIPREIISDAKECFYIKDKDFEIVERAVINGTILPKGHGDLIDRSKLETHYFGTDLGTVLEAYLVSTIDEAPIIIKADKAESEVE